MSSQLVYIASSKTNNTYGISVAELDYESGKLKIIQQDDTIGECQYLNLHPNGKTIYATAMDNNCEVHAFSIDDSTGHIAPINGLSAAGGSPCYVIVDDSETNVLMVNYNTVGGRGNIRIYPLGENGELLANSEMIEHDGNSVNPDRQMESHPHMIVTTPDNRFTIVPDLGTDKIYIYQLDTDKGKLRLQSTVDMVAGAGPRHVAFHPTQNRVYVINELDSTLVAFQHDRDSGAWTHLRTLSTLPDDYQEPPGKPNYPADVHVHPNGKFLYGSNRQHDSLVIYALDEEGLPSLVGHQSTLGHWPRAFMIDPTGQILIVGNERSDSAMVFAIDSDTGLLTHKSTLELPAPMAFKMMT